MYRFKSYGAVSMWYPVTGLSCLEIEICDYLGVKGENCIEIMFRDPDAKDDTTDIVDGKDHIGGEDE